MSNTKDPRESTASEPEPAEGAQREPWDVGADLDVEQAAEPAAELGSDARPEHEPEPDTHVPSPADVDQLSDLDRAILDFEGRLWKKTAIKERAIGIELQMPPTQYYLRLAALVRTPQAAQYAPATVAKVLAYRARTRGRDWA